MFVYYLYTYIPCVCVLSIHIHTLCLCTIYTYTSIEIYSFDCREESLFFVPHSTVLKYLKTRQEDKDAAFDLRISFSSLLPELFPERRAMFDPQDAGTQGAG